MTMRLDGEPIGGGAGEIEVDTVRGIAIAPVEAPPMDADPPLTIMHVAAPAPFGGLERVVHALAAGQAAHGHRVHVAAIVDAGTGDAHPFIASFGGTGVEVHAIEVAPRAYRRERAEVRALLA